MNLKSDNLCREEPGFWGKAHPLRGEGEQAEWDSSKLLQEVSRSHSPSPSHSHWFSFGSSLSLYEMETLYSHRTSWKTYRSCWNYTCTIKKMQSNFSHVHICGWFHGCSRTLRLCLTAFFWWLIWLVCK